MVRMGEENWENKKCNSAMRIWEKISIGAESSWSSELFDLFQTNLTDTEIKRFNDSSIALFNKKNFQAYKSSQILILSPAWNLLSIILNDSIS